MSRISIVSASAGSGKTFRLASELKDAITRGEARPEAVVATTFTVKAAAELRERVRRRLLRDGEVTAAQRLGAARMGTVNAVCGQLIRDHAFLLGLPPEQRVLDEATGKAVFHRALARVLSQAESAELGELRFRLGDLDWRQAVRKVVEQARLNGVAPGELVGHGARSTASLLALLDAPAADGATLEADLRASVDAFVSGYDAAIDATQKTRKVLQVVDAAARRLARGAPLPWEDWARLSKIQPGVKSAELGAAVRAAAGAHDRHPRLRDELCRLIALVYEIAARALTAYQAVKRDLGAVDFADQESLALALLRREDVRDRLRGEVDLVLVDEFQDTSPVQLAIFLELARVAKRSVWVGDQKQAIYAFRGTDPALMDAAVETILEGAEPDRLTTSYRSRPLLVDLTSDLFGKAFARQAIPPERVTLEANLDPDPPELGPPVERWVLESTNQAGDAEALASAVARLVADDAVRVRDVPSGRVRRLQGGDVAVLCRTNDACARVADALAAVGLRAEMQRAGLLATPEGRYVLAGLRLWVDPRDSLAAAELARLARYADREDAFLAAALARPRGEGFREEPAARAIEAAREAAPLAGPVAALDAVLLATGAREQCLRWGDSPQRLANLDALRGCAVAYASDGAGGAGFTPAGLIAHLEALAEAKLDAQGSPEDSEAVCVRTWHGAKGLEWPVTVLFELQKDYAGTALGVRVAADRDTIDLDDPMGGRWIRYWPWPYGKQKTEIPFATRLAGHPAEQVARERGRREALRLLYVGWTRARDRLVLAGRRGKLNAGILAHLADAAGAPLLAEPDPESAETTWSETRFPTAIRVASPAGGAARPRDPGEGYDPAGPASFPPATFNPSSAEATGVAGTPERIGPRLTLTGAPDMQALGEAVHGFLAADRPALAPGDRAAFAAGLLERWGVAGCLDPADLCAAADRFGAWAAARWPTAAWRRELPVAARRPDGSQVRGVADLVLELPAGFVVVDHKSFPGTQAQALERVTGYSGQLDGYATALAQALSKPAERPWVHLPVMGLVVPVEPGPGPSPSGDPPTAGAPR